MLKRLLRRRAEEPVVVKLREGKLIVLSDLHLGLRTSRARSNYEAAASLLRSLRGDNDLKGLVLLGDIVELWQSSAKDLLEAAYTFFREALSLDVPLYYVTGNHDRIITHSPLELGRGKGRAVIVPDYLIVDAGDKACILLHGHQLDRLFLATRGLWRLESYVYTLSEALISLPGPSEWVIAMVSVASSALVFTVSSTLPPHVKPIAYYGSVVLLLPLVLLVWRYVQSRAWYLFLAPLFYGLAGSRMRYRKLRELELPLREYLSEVPASEREKVRCAVLGHTHVPEMVEVGGLTLVNAGSWVSDSPQPNTFVELSRDKVRLLAWSGGEVKVLGERKW